VTDLRAWDALAPEEVASVFAGVAAPWWLAGGWAVELAVGRAFRSHADTDVLVLRPSVPLVQAHLAGWDLHAADPPGTLRPWPPGEVLAARALRGRTRVVGRRDCPVARHITVG
jgi:hypothetical protein